MLEILRRYSKGVDLYKCGVSGLLTMGSCVQIGWAGAPSGSPLNNRGHYFVVINLESNFESPFQWSPFWAFTFVHQRLQHTAIFRLSSLIYMQIHCEISQILWQDQRVTGLSNRKCWSAQLHSRSVPMLNVMDLTNRNKLDVVKSIFYFKKMLGT